MGIADRDYHQQERRIRSEFFPRVTPVVAALLIANLAIYFIDLAIEAKTGSKPLREFGIFTIQSAVHERKIWEFLTFQFLHGSVGHVVFNCIGLYFFGPWLERWWGTARFLAYYLLCGVAGALFFMLLVGIGLLPAGNAFAGLLGASAGIYGILIGVAVIAPDLRVSLLFPPIELSMRQMAMALMAIAAGSVIFHWGGNEGGEAGHLGGAILGFLIMKNPWLLRWDFERKKPRATVAAPRRESKLRPRTHESLNQETAVDRILDKISRDGFQSLTPEEREFLQQASKKK